MELDKRKLKISFNSFIKVKEKEEFNPIKNIIKAEEKGFFEMPALMKKDRKKMEEFMKL